MLTPRPVLTDCVKVSERVERTPARAHPRLPGKAVQ
jgi:hypothetical protein